MPLESTTQTTLGASPGQQAGGSNPRSQPLPGQEAHSGESQGSDVKEQAKQLKQEATQAAQAAKQRLMEQGQNAVAQQKECVAGECEVFGAAVREAAHKLEEEGHEKVACYAEACADEFDRAAKYIRERDFAKLYDDASCFARKHPEVVLGGMFLAGVAIARLMKASSAKSRNLAYSDEPVSPEFGESATTDEMVNPYTQVDPAPEGATPVGPNEDPLQWQSPPSLR